MATYPFYVSRIDPHRPQHFALGDRELVDFDCILKPRDRIEFFDRDSQKKLARLRPMEYVGQFDDKRHEHLLVVDKVF